MSNNKIITFKERGSKLTLLNKEQLQANKITVDGCEITSGLRCDYMLFVNDTEFFIELKGQDLHHAIKQLSTTMKKLSVDVKKQKKVSFIICVRSPMNAASIQNERVRFKKYFGSDLIVKSSPYTYSL